MSIPAEKPSNSRRPALTRDRIIAAAMDLADTDGIGGVSMRRLGKSLGVEAMSLYNHVSGRDDVLDGMVDAVFAVTELPDPASDWKSATRRRAFSARAALKRHRWAVGLMDSRTNAGAATLRHHDAVIGILRSNGFSVRMAAHAVSLVDSYVYGFVLQEVSLPFETEGELSQIAEGLLDETVAAQFPHFTEFAREHALQPGYDFGEEFGFGLDLILDGLAPDET